MNRILAGTRPYWWINETDMFTNFTRPYLRQTHLTCETSAGNPSGHVMFTASILFFIIRTLFYESSWCRRYLNNTLKCFLWNIYIGILGLITIARMFFACHFFHQCFLGSCCGITVSQLIQHPRLNRILIELNKSKAFLLGCAMVMLSIAVYFGHYMFSMDPQWAVQKVKTSFYYLYAFY